MKSRIHLGIIESSCIISNTLSVPYLQIFNQIFVLFFPSTTCSISFRYCSSFIIIQHCHCCSTWLEKTRLRKAGLDLILSYFCLFPSPCSIFQKRDRFSIWICFGNTFAQGYNILEADISILVRIYLET